MSSIDSASMPGTEVSEKTPVDFGAKAVSLKSQSDSARLLQSTGQIRNLPVHGNVRPALGVNTTHTPSPVISSASSQKAGVLFNLAQKLKYTNNCFFYYSFNSS